MINHGAGGGRERRAAGPGHGRDPRPDRSLDPRTGGLDPRPDRSLDPHDAWDGDDLDWLDAPGGRRPSRQRIAIDAVTAVLAIAGITLIVIGGSPPTRPERGGATAAEAAPAATRPTATGPTATAETTSTGSVAPPPPPGPPAPAAAEREPSTFDGVGPAPLGRSVPVRLTIPAIGVDTPLVELGLHPDGTIEVPPVAGKAPAGWYRNLASPGEVGPAVMLGHVDSARDGPAVFFRLRELRQGDQISVKRADGRTAVFTVDRVAEYAKAAFPTGEVYGGLDHSALRLVTCGGQFDKFRREYLGNVVAYATLTSTG